MGLIHIGEEREREGLQRKRESERIERERECVREEMKGLTYRFNRGSAP